MVELLADDTEGAGRVSRGDQRVGDEPDQARVVEVGLLRLWEPGVVPELEGLEVVLGGLLGTADGAGIVTGTQARRQRGRVVLGEPGVARELRGGAAGAAVLEGLRVRRVQAGALAGQEVVVHRLGEQGVAELVEVVAARHHHVALDGVADGTVELGGLEVDDGAERGVGDPTAGHRGGADHGDRGVVEVLQAQEEELGEVLGDTAGAGARGTDQLLDEERVALGAADDVADACLGQGVGVQLLHETAYVGPAERLDLDALDAAHPRPDGDLAAERVAAVQVVGAVRRDQRDRGVEAAAEQEAHQVAGGLVGPVEVLDDEEQALVGAGRLGEGVDGVEEGGLVGREGLGVGGHGQHPLAGQQTEQCGVALGDLVEQVGQLTRDAAGDLGEGEVGQGAVGEVEAVTGLDQPAVGDGTVAELGQQAGLADAGVAGEEDGFPVGGAPRYRDAERGAKLLQLGISSDQLRCHVVHLVADHGHRHLS